MSTSTNKSNYPSKVVWPFRCKWTVDTLPGGQKVFAMQAQTPCSDHVETKGLIYFARMLDKIRLKGRGELPPDYFTGVDEDPTMFDARCTRFLDVNYDELVERTLKGGSDEEILEWCFERGRRPSDEEISVWNAFLLKRGWRDDASADLQAAKERSGLGNRDDIKTWVDLHDAEEGRKPLATLVH
jgi:Domain of unknown function (DUF5069)